MTESLTTLLVAMAAFVGSHFILTGEAVRKTLIERFGETGHRALFSLVAVASLAWVALSFGAARTDNIALWAAVPAMSMIPVLVMPVAVVLIVCAVTTRSPTAAGGERLEGDPRPQTGIVTVTRHPMLVGVTLWSAAHIPPNGDAASVILFGGLAVLSIGGMVHIDQRRHRAMGANWGPIALTTSIVPFVAAIQGRTRVDWAGIGLWRVAVGLLIYAGLAYGHQWVAGVAILR